MLVATALHAATCVVVGGMLFIAPARADGLIEINRRCVVSACESASVRNRDAITVLVVAIDGVCQRALPDVGFAADGFTIIAAARRLAVSGSAARRAATTALGLRSPDRVSG
jgi:hypothetical protein